MINILIKDGSTYKQLVFGQLNEQNVKYLTSALRNLILVILVCLKNIARSLANNYLLIPRYFCVSNDNPEKQDVQCVHAKIEHTGAKLLKLNLWSGNQVDFRQKLNNFIINNY